jgi:hypothetical protein
VAGSSKGVLSPAAAVAGSPVQRPSSVKRRRETMPARKNHC